MTEDNTALPFWDDDEPGDDAGNFALPELDDEDTGTHSTGTVATSAVTSHTPSQIISPESHALPEVEPDDIVDTSGSNGGNSVVPQDTENISYDPVAMEYDNQLGQKLSYEQEGHYPNYPLGQFTLDEILGFAFDADASDVHILPNDFLAFTIHGEYERQIHLGVITPQMTEDLYNNESKEPHPIFITSVQENEFTNNLELDTSYVVKSGDYMGRRTRLSVAKSHGSYAMTFRLISDNIKEPEELGITDDIMKWTNYTKGLVMVNGQTGSGKSTMLASMMHHIQMTKKKKIITIEKPIEFLYRAEGMGAVMQREVGVDTISFARALVSALRQNPDIIMIGEVRNREEVNELLQAAESGHLAMTTMHTKSASAALNRIKTLFEPMDQQRVMSMLSDSLRGIVNQELVLKADGSGLFPVREILDVNREISEMIRVGDVKGIREYQMKNESTMEHALVRAAVQGLCTWEEAQAHAPFVYDFEELKKEHFNSLSNDNDDTIGRDFGANTTDDDISA